MKPSRRTLVALSAGTAFARGSAAGSSAPPIPVRDVSRMANVKDFGATGDGVSDDTAAFLAAASSQAQVLVPAGRFLLSRDVAFAAPVQFDYQGILQTAAGVTIAFNGGLAAGVHQIFAMGGRSRVTVNSRFTVVGHPEWWGAETNNPSVDCQGAIQACVVACQTTQLLAADYHTTSTIKIDIHNRVLAGVASNQNGNPGASRILLDSATADGLQVGFDHAPTAGPPAFLEHVTVKHLTVIRTVPPTPRPATDIGEGFFTSPAGVRMQYTVSCYLDDINSIQHSNGFFLQGVVHSYLKYCQALRNTDGSTADNDFFNGFFQNNSINIGYNSGNASLYLRSCSTFVSGKLHLTGSSGIYSYGGFTDTFIKSFECAGLGCGLNMNGAGENDKTYSSEDLLIDSCVLDGCTTSGIIINAGNNVTAVTIHNCYIAIAGPGIGIDVKHTKGPVSMVGCQIISGVGSAGIGISVDHSSGVLSDGNILTDVHSPISYQDATNCRSTDIINNIHLGASPAVVTMAGSSRCILRPIVKGATSINAAGVVLLGADNVLNEVDCSGVDASCVAGGAANKLICDNRQVRVAGPFASNNLASGIMD